MKNLLVTLTTTVLVMGCLSSCNEYLPDIAGTSVDAEKTEAMESVLNEYTRNFENRYGKIDPNHDWGFHDVVITTGIESSQATRGAADGMYDPTDPSQLHWYEDYGVVPPGAPADWNTNSPYGQSWAGGVTAEEILYVSEYFRTHTYRDMEPYMVQLHLTDFFVENVSSDSDQDLYSGNRGEGNVITSRGEVTGITYGMDCLIARTMDSSDDYSSWHHINNFNYGNTVNRPQQYADNSVNPYLPKDEAGHIALDLKNPTDDDVDKDIYRTEESMNKNRTCMYVHSSGTESFAYHPSWDDQSSFYESYVLVHLSFTVNGHHYEGNYLAFDWQGTQDGKHVDPDGYYNNWIIKVTPANYVPTQKFPVNRIFCEDLGNSHDFDFNDLVFDVKYEAKYDNGWPTSVEAVLIIQASGGTLPIWVGAKDDNHEAHYLLGNAPSETNIPINVAANPGKTHDVAIIRQALTQGSKDQYDNHECGWYYTGSQHNTNVYVNPNDINIWVGTTTASLVSKETLLPQSGKGDNKAPQKISIPYTDTRWLKESKQIEWGYGYFDEWVRDETKHAYFQPNSTTRNSEAWTEIHKATSSGPNGGAETSYLY